MRRLAWAACVAAAVAGIGCRTGPLLDNPILLQPDAAVTVENPVYIPLGPPAYGAVFEKVIDVINDYFEIAYENRYDGRITTFPRIAPGLERILMPGSPDCEQRTFATFQTIRHYAVVVIQVAEDGGFFIEVKVFKELEDLPRPIRATAGAAAFRSDNTVERTTEVIDQTVLEPNWIPIGQDHRLEQAILQRIKKCL
jgi:hypothetical protein